jgi:hypothetical protein
MTGGRRFTILLAAVLTGICPGRGLLARSPVVDPYYAARQAATRDRASQGSTDSEDGSYVYATDEEEQGVELVQPGSIVGQEPDEDTVVFEGGDGYPYDPNTCGRHHACGRDGCGACFHGGDLPYGDQIASYGGCYLEGGMPGYGDGHGLAPLPGTLWTDVHSHYRFWVNLNYLSYWVKGAWLPPLVTTSPLGTPQSEAGVLGEPNTSILFGNQRVNTGARDGARIQAGWWLVDGEFVGIDGSYWAITSETTRFAASSDFSPPHSDARILAQPFFNAALNVQDSLVLAYPNFLIGGIPVNLTGQVAVTSQSTNMQSASAGLRHLIFIDFVRDHRLFLTGGYRFFRMDEDLFIQSQINPEGGIFLPGTFFAAFDRFSTQTQFHGGYVGLLSDLRRGRFSLETNVQLGMGNVHEVVNIQGQQTIFDGITTTTVEGGLLAKPTNIGHHSRDQFALIPDVEFKAGFQVLPSVRLTAGYNFVYVTRVVRAGNEVDLVVNPNQNATQVIGPHRPEVRFNATNLWVQGVTTGVEIRF